MPLGARVLLDRNFGLRLFDGERHSKTQSLQDGYESLRVAPWLELAYPTD